LTQRGQLSIWDLEQGCSEASGPFISYGQSD
jgi:hypothetical protein